MTQNPNLAALPAAGGWTTCPETGWSPAACSFWAVRDS